MLFEANGDDESIREQIAFLQTVYTDVQVLSNDSREDTTCRTRQLLWATTQPPNQWPRSLLDHKTIGHK